MQFCYPSVALCVCVCVGMAVRDRISVSAVSLNEAFFLHTAHMCRVYAAESAPVSIERACRAGNNQICDIAHTSVCELSVLMTFRPGSDAIK